MRPLTEGLLIG